MLCDRIFQAGMAATSGQRLSQTYFNTEQLDLIPCWLTAARWPADRCGTKVGCAYSPVNPTPTLEKRESEISNETPGGEMEGLSPIQARLPFGNNSNDRLAVPAQPVADACITASRLSLAS